MRDVLAGESGSGLPNEFNDLRSQTIGLEVQLLEACDRFVLRVG
jgi:hypothetical protein